MKLFIVWLYELLMSIFADGVPENYDWSTVPVGEHEIFVGTVDPVEGLDLIRMHKLWHDMDQQADAGCEECNQKVLAALKPSGLQAPLNQDKALEVLRIQRPHFMEHGHAAMVEELFYEEIRNRFPDAVQHDKFEVRQGLKIVAVEPKDEPSMEFGGVVLMMSRCIY